MTPRTKLAIFVPLLICAGSTYAGHGHDRDRDDRRDADRGRYGDYARVLAARPIIETVTVARPERHCWEETVSYRGERGSATPAIVGGILGGVVGNRFGDGRGKDAMTVAGALLGASVGHDLGRRDHDAYPVTTERCRTEHNSYQEERVVGYDVSYRYQGRLYTTRLPYDPGDRLRVRVHVEPD